MARIGRVGHVVLRVTDVDAAEAFYRDALGMETVRRSEGAAFMSFGTQHHDIGLFSVNGEHTRGNVGLGHVALVVDGGMPELQELHQRLLDNGVEIASLTDHGMTKSVYFNDPDGNRLEIYVDLMEPLDGKRFLAERVGGGNDRFTFEKAAAR